MKESRRNFLTKCLGMPAVLSTSAIRPKSAIPSTFPERRFQFGQEVQHTLEFEDGELSHQVGVVVGINYEQKEWHYLIKWRKCCNLRHNVSYIPDQAEPSFVVESELKAV